MIGWTTLALLMCVLRGDALDLRRAAATPGGPEGLHDPDPPPVPKVRCWCVSYPNTTICSWPEPSHSPPTHYVATCSERHKESAVKTCHLVQPGSSSSALSSSSSPERRWFCHLPDLKLFTDYIINITAVRADKSTSYLSSFMLEDILKPDPPVDLQLSLSAKNLWVSWSPPPTWGNMDIIPLKYHIKYQWTSRNIHKSVTLGPFDSTKVNLKELIPGRSYLFQVCAKELLGLGECSTWSSPVEITLPRSTLLG